MLIVFVTCRGIPTGYIAALEQRLVETESALLEALHKIRALKEEHIDYSVEFDTTYEKLQQHDLEQSKAARVDEWKSFSLKTVVQRRHWADFKHTRIQGALPLHERSNSPTVIGSAVPQTQAEDTREASFDDTQLLHHDQNNYLRFNDQSIGMPNIALESWPGGMDGIDNQDDSIRDPARLEAINRTPQHAPAPFTSELASTHQRNKPSDTSDNQTGMQPSWVAMPALSSVPQSILGATTFRPNDRVVRTNFSHHVPMTQVQSGSQSRTEVPTVEWDKYF